MNENESDSLPQAKATPVINPMTEMAKIMCNEYLKLLELQECYKFVQSDFKKYYSKVETLTAAKTESAKVISEYKSRNKVNVTNSESLLQALNQLYNYKCELKSCYLATQKALKSKNCKYKKVLSSYDSAWNKALKEYTADRAFVKLQNIKQENALLEQEIARQEKLKTFTELDFFQLKEKSEKTFVGKTVEFSKAMVQYTDFLKSTKRNKKEEIPHGPKGVFQFTVLKSDLQPFGSKEPFSPDNSDDGDYSCSIDVSIFDDIMVPSENLENHNLEDDANSFGQSEGRQFSAVSKDHEENLDGLNNYQQTSFLKNKTQVQGSNENSLMRTITTQQTQQDEPKAATVNENESQYFRTRGSESSRQIACENVQMMEQNSVKSTDKPKNNMDRSPEKLKENGSMSQHTESEEEVPKDSQMESEGSVSEPSYEKQFGNQRAENYESQYQKTSSMSSDEPPGENLNENPGTSVPFYEQNTDYKPGCQTKENDTKSFPGFFTMGADQDTSKPSIFKLF